MKMKMMKKKARFWIRSGGGKGKRLLEWNQRRCLICWFVFADCLLLISDKKKALSEKLRISILEPKKKKMMKMKMEVTKMEKVMTMICFERDWIVSSSDSVMKKEVLIANKKEGKSETKKLSEFVPTIRMTKMDLIKWKKKEEKEEEKRWTEWGRSFVILQEVKEKNEVKRKDWNVFETSMLYLLFPSLL